MRTSKGMSALLLCGLCLGVTRAQGQSALKTTEADANRVAADVQAEAIWDGRKMVPFHALDNPKMVKAEQADFLEDGEYVLAMTINGEARAYPTRFVWWHHFVNDHTDKTGPDYPAFVVTYCSVCNTGVRFDPRVDGKPLLFDFYGLYNGVAVMSDRDTGSVWTIVEGRAIKGVRANQRMRTAPLLDTTWGEWKRLHPDTLVMSPDNEYKRVYRGKDKPEPRDYDQFPAPFFEPTLTRRDKRLPPFEKVLAVRLAQLDAKTESNPVPGGDTAAKDTSNKDTDAADKNAGVKDTAVKDADAAGKDALAKDTGDKNQSAQAAPPEIWLTRAYPIAALKAARSVVNDTLGNTPLAVFLEPNSTTANAVSRVVDGKTLTFESREENGKVLIVDKETGTRWSIEGVGETGPLAGKSLPRLDCHLSQWYGWAAYYPDTTIFGRTDPPQSEKAGRH